MYKIYVDASDRKNNIVRLIKIEVANQVIVAELAGEIDIAESIKNLLLTNNVDFSHITEFESFPGPGSFTGLKKSFVLTNVLNWALNKKSDTTNVPLPEYGKEPNIG